MLPAPPRSTSAFAGAGPGLAAMGYSPLPIAPGTKAPGAYMGDVWRMMRDWSRFCEKPVLPNIITGWSQFPDAGVGVALGRGLVAVDIDLDDAVEAVVMALPETPVAKRGAKGLTLFFREGATSVGSKPYPGFLDLLSTGRQTVLPPTRHPTTGRPYEWTTERTLHDTPLSELPEFPPDGFEIIESVLARFGYEARPARLVREPISAGRAHSPSGFSFGGNLDELNTAALGALDLWVPALNLNEVRTPEGFRAVARWRPSNSGAADSARGRNLSFVPQGIKDFGDGDRGYRPVSVVEVALGLDWPGAARWLADRIGFSLPKITVEPLITLVAGASAPSRRGEVAPPEQPVRRPLAEVKAALAAELGMFATRTVVEHRHKRAAYEGAIAANVQGCSGGALSFTPLPLEPAVTARCVSAETGAGKTHAFEHATATASRAGFRIYGAFPRHDVAEQVAANLRDVHGIAARAYRGRHAVDPEAAQSGTLMCLAPDMVKLAEDSRLPVYETVCASADGARCPFFDRCGYIKQRQAEPAVWTLPHASLAFPRPQHVEAADGVVIDETLSVIPGANETRRLGVDTLAHMQTDVEDDPIRSATLAAMRPKLVAALRASPEGFLSRDALVATGITAESASTSAEAERRRVRAFGMFPGMDPRQRAVCAKEASKVNGETMAAFDLWIEVAAFLRQNVLTSGRMKIVLDGKSKAARVEWRSLRRVHESWLTGPVMLTDATPVGKAYVEAALGRDVVVEVAPMLAVERNPHGDMIQVVGAPTSANKLGLRTDKPTAAGTRNRAEIRRYVLREAVSAWPRTVVVVTFSKMEAWLRTYDDWPTNVDFEHFGNVSGIDRWRKAATLIVIGRNGVPCRSLEADAGILTGVPAQSLPSGPRGEPWLQRVPGAILKADATTHVIETREFHPDPAVEMLRFRSNEGETLQAIGRLRQVHRTGAEPWAVHILNDQPLPLAVDEVRQWADAAPAACWDLAPEGVLFADRAEIVKAWSGRWSENEARERVTESSVVSPIKNHIRENHRTLRATFRRKGKAEVVAYLLPNGPRSTSSFEAWLNAHGFEGVADVVVGSRPTDRMLVSAVVEAMDEAISASPRDVWERVEARLGRPATAAECAGLRAAAMRDGEQRFVDRERFILIGPDRPVAADVVTSDEISIPMGPQSWHQRPSV